MKKYILLIPVIALMSSCGGNNEKEKTVSEDQRTAMADSAIIADSVLAAEEFRTKAAEAKPGQSLGVEAIIKQLYTGEFRATKFDEKKEPSYSNKITICLDSVSNSFVKGFSVVAGNRRNFTGTIKEVTKGHFLCEVKEPGDDKYDGKFSFTVMPDSSHLKGNWFANNKKLAVTERSFDLVPAFFTYDATLNLPQELETAELYNKELEADIAFERVSEQVTKVNASTTELKKSDVENLFKGDLEIIRNSIFARHGYSFKSKRMRYIFDQYVNWYIPLYTDVRGQLTKLELKNIELLKRYEEHAENYYDSYGR